MVPRAMEGLAGVTVIETNVTEVTVNVLEPEIEPEVALMVVEPALTVVASPAELIVATLVADDAQIAVLVRFWLDPSL